MVQARFGLLASFRVQGLAQRLQNPLIKEYALILIRVQKKLKVYSVIQEFWSLWEGGSIKPARLAPRAQSLDIRVVL